jgi:aminoglycoside phosphotransferase (APT) family kinase protein
MVDTNRPSVVPDLGPLPQRITVDAEQVRRLVSSQFPELADLPVRPVTNGGWDNWTFHLGAERLVRLPSAAEYALAVDKEHRWLPALAGQLPRPIPAPLAKGKPGVNYPYPWSIYQWLDGEPARGDLIANPVRFALDLAEFLVALQSIDASGGPQPGIHNWFRGGTLRTFDEKVHDALAELDGLVDAELVRKIWVRALEARWDGVDRWFHGDIAPGNLLLADGQLAAVIDFGTCGVGDPACDLAIAWTLLTADGREAFRERLAVDDSTWSRGRGWALWKTLASCPDTLEDPEDVREFTNAQRILGEIFSDYATGSVA